MKLCDINLLLKFLLPEDVEINNTIDDLRQRSNLTKKKQTGLLKKKRFSIQF